jgi:hypothetical protein
MDRYIGSNNSDTVIPMEANQAKAEARHRELMADWRTTHEKIEPHPEAMN